MIKDKINIMKFRGLFFAIFILTFICATTFSISLYAYPDGASGRTTSGCTCHSSQSANTVMSAFTQTGSWSVAPNSTTTFTVTLKNSSFTKGGVDIGVKTTSSGETNAGTLALISNYLKLKSNELVSTATTTYADSLQFKFTWTAPATTGTYYLKACGLAANGNGGTSGDQWNLLTPQAIVVESAASIALTSPNGGESYCCGSSQSITWTSTGIDNVKIELSSDGGSSFPTTLVASVTAASGSWTWDIPQSLTAGNNYRVRVSDATNASMNDVSNASFAIKALTQISQQPQSTSICVGGNAVFSVSASGSGLSYQWRKNNNNIQDAVTSTFSVNSVSQESAGNYDCVVTGACGNPVISSIAILNVDSPPTIVSGPDSVETCVGTSATFSVVAQGSNLTYQWQKDGQNIPNKTALQLILNNVQPTDEGLYSVIVSGKCTPPATSISAKLKIEPTPGITKDISDQTIQKGTNLTLSISATGNNLIYQWQKDGVDIKNATTSEYSIIGAKIEDAGNYLCVIKNNCGTIKSKTAKVTVNEAPAPNISLKHSNIDFGKVKVNDAKDSLFTAEISNTGNADLTISSISVTGVNSNEFSILNPVFPKTLKPAESIDLTISFKPSTGGNKIAQLFINNNSNTNPKIDLTGFGLILGLNTSQSELIFTFNEIGTPITKNIIVINKSNVELNTDISLSGKDKDLFSIFSGIKFKLTIDGQESAQIGFTPASNENREAVIDIITDYGIKSSVKIKAEYSTGISDNEIDNKIKILPNPASDNLTIDLNNIEYNILGISIYDINGNKIVDLSNQNQKSPEKIIFCNLNGEAGKKFSTGLYNLQIITDKKIISKSVIIIK